MAISIDRIKRNLEYLSRYTSIPESGRTRLSFSPEAKAAVTYLSREMGDAGNIIGRVEGEISDAPALMIALRYDSGKNGGDFDGIVGIELVRHFQEE